MADRAQADKAPERVATQFASEEGHLYVSSVPIEKTTVSGHRSPGRTMALLKKDILS